MRSVDDIRAACDRYVEDVVSGSRVAGELEKLAIERHIRKFQKYDINWERPRKHINFAELMPHIKGTWNPPTLVYDDWQVFLLSDMLAPVSPETGAQLHDRGYLSVARKNAKTTMGACLGTSFMIVDGEPGPEIYSAATTKDQAAISWGISRDMWRKLGDKDMQRFKITLPKSDKFLSSITCGMNNGFFKPMTADPKTQDGANVYFGLVDEYHEHPTSGLYGVLLTGTGSRLQSYVLVTTTAGFNLESPCYTLQKNCAKILRGQMEHDEQWCMIYTLDDGDDPHDQSVWPKPNPAYGKGLYPRVIRSAYKAAQEDADMMTEFLTKHMNVWVNGERSWMNMKKWDLCLDKSVTLESLAT